MEFLFLLFLLLPAVCDGCDVVQKVIMSNIGQKLARLVSDSSATTKDCCVGQGIVMSGPSITKDCRVARGIVMSGKFVFLRLVLSIASCS